MLSTSRTATARQLAVVALATLLLACSSSDSAKKKRAEGLAARLTFSIAAQPATGRTQQQLLDQALETVRNRVDQLGLREPAVYKRDGRIVVEIPDADLNLVERVKGVIAKRSALRFRLAVHAHPGMMALCRTTEQAAADATARVTAAYDSWFSEKAMANTRDCYLQAGDRATLEQYVEAHAAEIALGADQTILYEELAPAPGKHGSTWRTHVINRTAVLTGAHVRNAYVARSPESNEPDVRVEFDDDGRRLLSLMTRENIGTKLLMTLDDRVLSAPLIRDEITGGVSSIALGDVDPAEAEEQARELVVAIRAGSLPAPLRLESAIGF